MKTETKLAAVILMLSLAMPIVSYWSFRTGYRLYPEVHGRVVIHVPSAR